MKKQKWIIPGIIILICFFFYPAFSFADPLKSTMDAYVVVIDKEGKEKLKKTDTAAPGETIEYVLTYQNISKKGLSALSVNGPIPSNTGFVQGSNYTKTPHEFRVSIDHGKTWDNEPVRRKRKNKQGKEELIIIPASKYTNIQWKAKVNIDPGEKQTYKYRVKIY